MLTTIATGMITFGMGLWVGKWRVIRGCNARTEILKDILIEKGMEKWFKDPKLVDKFVDRIKRA